MKNLFLMMVLSVMVSGVSSAAPTVSTTPISIKAAPVKSGTVSTFVQKIKSVHGPVKSPAAKAIHFDNCYSDGSSCQFHCDGTFTCSCAGGPAGCSIVDD